MQRCLGGPARAELQALRRLLPQAFQDGFTKDDRHHTLGRLHVLALEKGEPVAHAAVVGRTLIAQGRPQHTGYVEGVASRPDRRAGKALPRWQCEEPSGSSDRATSWALSRTALGSPGFYEQLGWQRWHGPTFVAAPDGPRRTAEDDSVMVLPTPAAGQFDLAALLICDWRPGGVW